MTRISRSLSRIALAALAAALVLCSVDFVVGQTTTNLSGNVTVHVQLTKESAIDLGVVKFPLDRMYTQAFTFGAGANQIQRSYTKTRTIAASTSEDLDLAGSLTDELGQTLTFVGVKTIVVKASASNTNNVIVKPDATAGFLGPFGAVAHQLSIPPGGVLALTAPSATGWAVTATTADLLEFGNSGAGTSVTYEVIIAGDVS